ncbi:MAG: histidine kinase [Actinomycetota bacterium]
MKNATSRRIAWILLYTAIVFSILAFVFLVLGRHTPSPPGTFGFRGFSAIFALSFAAVGALIALRRPENPIGWIFLVTGVMSGWQESTQQYAIYALFENPGSLPAGEIFAWFAAWIWIPITGILTTFLFLLFPTGRLLSRRWRLAAVVAMAGVATASFATAFASGPMENFALIDNPFGIPGSRDLLFPLQQIGLMLYAAGIVASSTSLVVRFRRSRGEERQQVKWLVASAILVVSGLIVSFVFAGAQTIASTTQWKGVDVVVIFAFLTIPAATGVAILKYRLYDIDVVINKTVVYGVLAACITAFYVAFVIGIGSLVGTRGGSNVFLSIAATALIAVAFQPARQRVQRFADRLVYGERVTPYEAMADFSHRMSGSLSLDEVLPRMAEASARGVGAQRARVRVFLPGGGERIATWPQNGDGNFETTVAVVHRSQEIGEIAIAKPASAPMNPAERKLLEDLASQASLALGNVRLTEDLKESRQRIVAAQDTERRRIERDLHDGAQQQLVAMKIKLGLVKQMLERDPIKAGQILEGLMPEADAAIENLRDLARGIFPQMLVENGLEAALRSHVSKSALNATVESNIDTVRFESTIEANVYFCIREALQNASKHAPGARIVISLFDDGEQLAFGVHDEGPGFDSTKVELGSGLRNMSDRVQALGGVFEIETGPGLGTWIKGQLPSLR